MSVHIAECIPVEEVSHLSRKNGQKHPTVLAPDGKQQPSGL